MTDATSRASLDVAQTCSRLTAEPVDLFLCVAKSAGLALYDTRTHAAVAREPSEADGAVGARGMSDDEARITRQEMLELFGEEMPIEAVTLVFCAGPDDTVGQVRAKLRALARARGMTTIQPTPDPETDPVARLVLAARKVVAEHDEWKAAMPPGAEKDPLYHACETLRDRLKEIGA